MSDNPRNEAVVDLFMRYSKIVYNHCLMMVSYENRYVSLIDDCIQEAFVIFLLDYDKLSSHSNHAGWLCNTAWNRLRSEIRKTNGRDLKHEEIAAMEQVYPSDAEAALEHWGNRDEAQFQIASIYAILTDMEQTVYQGYFLDELSISETAKKTNLSENSVRSAIDRIRKRARNFENFLLILLIMRCIYHFWRTN